MLGRCFHGEIQIWSRHEFYASLIYEQKSGAIRNYRKGTGQTQRAGVQNGWSLTGEGAAEGVRKQEGPGKNRRYSVHLRGSDWSCGQICG